MHTLLQPKTTGAKAKTAKIEVAKPKPGSKAWAAACVELAKKTPAAAQGTPEFEAFLDMFFAK